MLFIHLTLGKNPLTCILATFHSRDKEKTNLFYRYVYRNITVFLVFFGQNIFYHLHIVCLDVMSEKKCVLIGSQNDCSCKQESTYARRESEEGRKEIKIYAIKMLFETNTEILVYCEHLERKEKEHKNSRGKKGRIKNRILQNNHGAQFYIKFVSFSTRLQSKNIDSSNLLKNTL